MMALLSKALSAINPPKAIRRSAERRRPYRTVAGQQDEAPDCRARRSARVFWSSCRLGAADRLVRGADVAMDEMVADGVYRLVSGRQSDDAASSRGSA